VDAVVIARHLGITLRERDTEASEERRQWLAARAIGSVRKKALMAAMGADAESGVVMSGESLITLFAEHLLVPAQWFNDDAGELGFDVWALKDRYRTAAMETIALRMLDLPQPCVITILNDDRILKRRSNGPRVRKELTDLERECQRHVSERREMHVVQRGGWTVQGWQAGDQQILRSVVDSD
jgi:hypothetical protein